MTMPFVHLSLSVAPRLNFMGNGNFTPDSHASYCLPENWALHLYHYRARLRLGEEWLDIAPGTLGLTPPGVSTHYEWQHDDSSHDCAHFLLPSGGDWQVPALIDLGSDYRGCHDIMQAAIESFPITPHRSEAMIWMMLWDVVTRASTTASTRHPALQQAIGYIERHLAEPLLVADVAKRVNLSHNHLTRLFKADLGTTVIGYIRQRRAERAERLLRQSSLPVKAVAIEVGIPNLQQFNKLIRERCGVPPRSLRG